MADYRGNYEDDLGFIYPFIRLRVYIFDTTDNSINNTSVEFDSNYLPPVFINHVDVLPRRGAYCTLSFNPRFARLWLNNSQYLRVDLPFKGGTYNHNQFSTSLSFNSLITDWGVRGEIIDRHYLNHKMR